MRWYLHIDEKKREHLLLKASFLSALILILFLTFFSSLGFLFLAGLMAIAALFRPFKKLNSPFLQTVSLVAEKEGLLLKASSSPLVFIPYETIKKVSIGLVIEVESEDKVIFYAPLGAYPYPVKWTSSHTLSLPYFSKRCALEVQNLVEETRLQSSLD